MTGSAVKRSGTKWTVAFPLPFKQGGWFGRGVVKKFEPTEGGRMTGSAVERSGTKWTVVFTLPLTLTSVVD